MHIPKSPIKTLHYKPAGIILSGATMGVIDAKQRFLERRSQAELPLAHASSPRGNKKSEDEKPQTKVLSEDIRKGEDAKALEQASIAFVQDLNRRFRNKGFSG
jgi:hypothetical protein